MSTTTATTIATPQNKPTVYIYVNELINGLADIIEVLDENFIVIDFYKLQFIYSTADQKFNATKLVPSISGSKYPKWQGGQVAQTFIKRFPQFFTEYKNKSNYIRGTYLDMTLLPIIVSWCNPVRGYYLINGLAEDINNEVSGYVYIVQPPEFLGTDVKKIGRTWKPQQRFRQYGNGTKFIRCERISNMTGCEDMIMSILSDYKIKKAWKAEYYLDQIDPNGNSMVEYCFEEAIKRFPYVENEDEIGIDIVDNVDENKVENEVDDEVNDDEFEDKLKQMNVKLIKRMWKKMNKKYKMNKMMKMIAWMMKK
jgi:hypothetical protein